MFNKWKFVVLVGISLLLSAAMVYGFVFPLDSLTPYWRDQMSDVGQNVWNLWHVTESILSFQNPFITDNVYYPVGANLGTHTLASGYFPVALLVKVFTGNSEMYPVYSFNIILLFGYAAIFMFTYLSLREVGYSLLSSAIPAVAYGFCDFYYLHWLHLNHLAGFTLPLSAWLIIRLVKKPSFGRGLAVSIILAWSVYLTEFALSIAIAAALLLCLVQLKRESRNRINSVLKSIGLKNAVALVSVFCILIAPFVIHYFLSGVELPARKDFSDLSANLAGLFIPDTHSTWLYGDLFVPLANRITIGLPGWEVFVGFPILLFTFVGMAKRKPFFGWMSLVVALVFFMLSLGPTLKVFETDTGIPLPYWALMDLPPFNQNRCPVRFAAIGTYFLLFVTADGLELLRTSLMKHMHHHLAIAVVSLILVWTMLETYSVPSGVRKPYEIPVEASQLVEGPTISISHKKRACNQVLGQVFHKQPIANGCLARTTIGQRQFLSSLRLAFERDLDEYAHILKRHGFKNVIVDRPLSTSRLEQLRLLPFNIVELDEVE